MSPALAATLVAGTTLLLSLLLPFAVRPLLVRLGIMDVPNERSSHSRPVLRGLGLAVLIAMLVGGLLGVVLLRGGRSFGDRWDLLLVIVLASLAAGILGLGEDLHGVSVRARSIWLILIALAGPGALLLLASRPFPGTGFAWIAGTSSAPLQLEWWSAILLLLYAMLFVSGYINVANFVDGLNGISGLHGVIAGLAFAAAGWMTGLGWLVLAGLVLAAGFAGFLPWNLTKPGAFLGDVGSYLLGGAVAITSFAALLAGVPLLATIGPMVITFGDVGVTLVKRVREGKRWDEPHKEHTYQRIEQRGYSHLQASLLAAGCTLLTSLLGLGSLFVGLGGALLLFAGGLLVLLVYLALPRLLPARA